MKTPLARIPAEQAAVSQHATAALLTRIDMSRPDGRLIRDAARDGGTLELRDSNRPDVTPLILDDFLMAVLRGEIN